jgi:hypothetical protein
VSGACVRCGVRWARGEYNVWRPDLCAVCVEEVKHPTLRRGAVPVGTVCARCGLRPASGDAWQPAVCVECIGVERESANRMLADLRPVARWSSRNPTEAATP